MTLPGSHDSASCTISPFLPFSGVGRCQNLSVYDQLVRGVRYLDLRLGADTGATPPGALDDIYICHGILKGGPFADTVSEVHKFIEENPGEFLIIEMAKESDMLPCHQFLALNHIKKTFGDAMITNEDVEGWFKCCYATLSDLESNGKRLLVVANDKLRSFEHDGTRYDGKKTAEEFDCHPNNRFITNRWHDTDDPSTLMERNVAFKKRNGDCKKLLVSQFVMTPKMPGTPSDAFLLLVGQKTLRPVSLAQRLYRGGALEDCLSGNADEHCWGIVLLDFVDLTPRIMR